MLDYTIFNNKTELILDKVNNKYNLMIKKDKKYLKIRKRL